MHAFFFTPGDDCLNTFKHGHFIPAEPGQSTSAKGVMAHYECFKSYIATDGNAYKCLDDGQWNTDTDLLCRSYLDILKLK